MKKIFLLASLFISSYTYVEANEDNIQEIIDALDVASKISAEDKEWLDQNDANIISFKDIDFDGHKELVIVHKARGNRHVPEYKAYNLDDYDLVIHYRMDAVFDPVTKTVVNGWHSDYCTHETETYQATNNTLEMVRLEFSDYEPDGYGCILRIFESSSDVGNKSLQDFDDEMLRMTGEQRYGMAGANLELIYTKCYETTTHRKHEVWRQCDSVRTCSEFVTFLRTEGSGNYPIFSITNNNVDGIKGFYTKFTDINTGKFVEQIGIVAETPVCIETPKRLKAKIQSLAVHHPDRYSSGKDCHQQFIAGYEEGKTVFIKTNHFGRGINAEAATDFHLGIINFKFSKEDEWICK